MNQLRKLLYIPPSSTLLLLLPSHLSLLFSLLPPLPPILLPQRSVVKVVREKYLNQVTPDDQAKFHKFLSELYVFLVDQMHVGLKKVWSPLPLPLLFMHRPML